MTNLAHTTWFGPVIAVVFLLQLAALVYVIVQWVRDRRDETIQIDRLVRERDYLFEAVKDMDTTMYLMGEYVDIEWLQNKLDTVVKKIKSGELK